MWWASSAPSSAGRPSKPGAGGKGDRVLGSLSVTHSEGVAGGADRSVRMTTRKHFKRRVRSRAAQTGEPYATALRRIRQQQETRTPSDSASDEEVFASCSFCGKPDTEVRRLVAGPGVYICDECVHLSVTIIEDSARSTPEEVARRRSEHRHRPSEDILAMLPALLRSVERVEGELAVSVHRLRARGVDWRTIADATGMSVDHFRRRFTVVSEVEEKE